jgi:hypothetical protein
MNGPQSDTYSIMLMSFGTTPLKIFYAGRLEYARVCVYLQVLRGKRDMWRATQGRPADEFIWLLTKGDFILHLPFWNSFPWEVNSFPEPQNIKESEAVYGFWEQILIFVPWRCLTTSFKTTLFLKSSTNRPRQKIWTTRLNCGGWRLTLGPQPNSSHPQIWEFDVNCRGMLRTNTNGITLPSLWPWWDTQTRIGQQDQWFNEHPLAVSQP